MPRNPGHPIIQDVRLAMTHCVNGHELTESNTRYSVRVRNNKRQFYRVCKKCAAIREANRRAKLS